MAHSLNLSTVGLSNESYSVDEEALIRQALIAEQRLMCSKLMCAQPIRSVKLMRAIEQKSAERIARYKAALAPHKKLPEDVIREIFNFVCHIQILRPQNGNAGHAVIRLSRVCSAWRRIALNMPRLWAGVNMDNNAIDDDKIYNEYCNIRLAKLWLARGGSIPRSLKVSSISYSCSAMATRCDPCRIRQLVESFPYRCLHLHLCWEEMTVALKDISPEQMLPLDSLCMMCKYPPDGNDIYLHLSLPTKLPNLTHLGLNEHFQGNLEKLITAVPWNKLEQLELRFPIPSTRCFSLILSEGLSLTHCLLKPAMDGNFAGLHIAEPLVMPEMMVLILACQGGVDVQTFKRWVQTPGASDRRIFRE